MNLVECSARMLTDENVPWSDQIETVRRGLGAPRNPFLFPAYYLKATFRNIGGRIAVVEKGRKLLGAAFLFPRSVEQNVRTYTLRYHAVEGETLAPDDLISLLMPLVRDSHFQTNLIFYDPQQPQSYVAREIETISLADGSELKLHTPAHGEAVEIR